MRIGELSRRTGVSVPTIKYYLREGMVQPGVRTGPNQSQYAEIHVRRLRLIRVLMDIGGLSVAGARDVLASLDSPTSSVFEMLGKVQRALIERWQPRLAAATEVATREAADAVGRRGWRIRASGPGMLALSGLLSTLRQLGDEDFMTLLDAFAEAAERLAQAELEVVRRRPDVYSMAEAVVVGTILGDAILTSLRRLAEEDAAARAFAG